MEKLSLSTNILKDEFYTKKINKKLAEYYNLSYDELYKEVKKQYKEITRKESDKLETEYKLSIDIIKSLQNEIDYIDKEIDKHVYGLYGLTERRNSYY